MLISDDTKLGFHFQIPDSQFLKETWLYTFSFQEYA